MRGLIESPGDGVLPHSRTMFEHVTIFLSFVFAIAGMRVLYQHDRS